MTGCRVPVRAEHDDVSVLLLGERAEALTGRGVNDDVALDVLVPVLSEPRGAAIDDPLGVALGPLLTALIALAAVAYVGD